MAMNWRNWIRSWRQPRAPIRPYVPLWRVYRNPYAGSQTFEYETTDHDEAACRARALMADGYKDAAVVRAGLVPDDFSPRAAIAKAEGR